MSENGENYTAGKNFTLPPALTAWTISTSEMQVNKNQIWRFGFHFKTIFELAKRQSTAHACVVYGQEKPKNEF